MNANEALENLHSHLMGNPFMEWEDLGLAFNIISAELSELRKQTWQPIESAPKIGRIIGSWLDGKWHCREMLWRDMEDEWVDTMSDRYLSPTHWIPLPPAPESEV